MTVHVLYFDYGYEGMSEVEGVFSSREKALDYAKKECEWRSGEIVVEEWEVDGARTDLT